MKAQWMSAVAVLTLLGGLAAQADDTIDPNQPTLYSKIGMSAELGGGVIGFTNSSATGITQPGGSWTARVTFGTRSHFAAEAAYIASAQGLTTLGLSDSAVLLSNGVEGNLRFNALTGAWQPYATVGVAWRHYSVQNSATNTSDVQNNDDVAEVPVGLGMSYRYHGILGDLRVSLRNAFQSSLIPNTNLTAWDVGGRIGFEF